MISIDMDETDKQSLPYIDALIAFWPGLQALMGDLKPAVVYHQILHHIVRRNGFLPEAFHENMQVNHHFTKIIYPYNLLDLKNCFIQHCKIILNLMLFRYTLGNID